VYTRSAGSLAGGRFGSCPFSCILSPAAPPETESTVSRRVLFHPQPPRPEAILTVLCARLGYEIVLDPGEPHDVALFWTTRTIRRANAALRRAGRGVRVLNLACDDIGKRRVDRVFESVFGYRSLVNPRTHQGIAVRKSNLNAQHDGRVVRCPVRTVRRTSVYQRLINNASAGAFVEDLRTPVFGGDIPFVYVIRKPLRSRFGSPVDERIAETAEVFSADELDRIRRFAAAMGLDYAELDILRDADDGRIVIVDANPTPWGPTSMDHDELQAAYARLAAAFERLVRLAIDQAQAARAPATRGPQSAAACATLHEARGT
jgi:hypothetical protein